MAEPPASQPRILLFIPYFGAWPEWIDLFLETCRWNPAVDWLFLTDCPPPANWCPNVRYHPTTLAELERRAEARLGFHVPLRRPYKVCDLRLSFALLFDDLARGYDYLGWSDVDVVYGDLGTFLTGEALAHDLISFNAVHLSGHLALMRNTPAAHALADAVPGWREKVVAEEYMHLDEPAPEVFGDRFRVHARESFNTPLSPIIPWRDGTFSFPREWCWSRGTLTNDKDAGIEFPYLHFMHWKGGWWPRQCGNAQWERLDRVVHLDSRDAHRGFRINEGGFFALDR